MRGRGFPQRCGLLRAGVERTRPAVSIPAPVGVNEPFREEESYAVPPRLLEQLPPLPGDIQYRILGSGLVLWDVHADIIIDVLPDAFRAPSHVSSK